MSRTTRRSRLLIFLAFTFLPMGAPHLAEAAPLQDHSLIKPYPGSTLVRRENEGFRDYKVVVGLNQKGKTDDEILPSIPVSGELTRLFYENPKEKSLTEILANYKEGLEAAGFKILFQCVDTACGPGYASSRWGRVNGMRYVSSSMGYLAAQRKGGDEESYVALSIMKLRHQIDVLQVKQMERGLVTVTAAALEKGLSGEGKAVLDGLFFDHDKATIKPESKPALDVIAKFLKDQPSLKVFIVGHTDSAGTLDYNLNLSRQRAQAVVAALTKDYGIAADRLAAHGVGPLSPARTNRSDQGKSANRRVEMVER